MTPRDDDPETTVDLGELARDAASSFETADAARTSSFDGLAQLGTARTYILQRKRADLIAREADEATIRALDAEIAESIESVHSFAAQSKLAGTPTPTAEEREFVVYGFVHGADGKPLRGLKVSLVNKQGQVKATASTDENGHYVLTHQFDDRELKLQVRVEHPEAPAAVPVEPTLRGVIFVPIRIVK